MSQISKTISPFAKKIIKGTFWLTLGTLLSRALLSIAYIFLARILSTDEYGQYGMLKSTIDNFYVFASMGIGLTTTKYISEYKNSDKKAASSILGTSLITVLLLGTALALLIYLFSTYISTNLLQAPQLSNLLNLVALIIVFSSVNGIQNGALLGTQSFDKIAFVNIIQGVLLFLGICIGGYLYGVFGAVVGNLISIILLSLIVQYMLKVECNKIDLSISLNNWKQSLKIIYKFALPASLSTIITAPTIWILNTMLVKTQNGYSELGVYSAVVVVATAIQMFNGSINSVLLPIFLSNEAEKTPKKEFFNYFGTWIISLLVALPFFVFPEIVNLILGNKYAIYGTDIKWILSFTLFSTLIIAQRQGLSRDLIIKNKMWLSVFSMGQWAITTYICFLYLMPYGALGFAGAFCIGYVINAIVFLPIFIYLQICPKYVFFDINIVAVWILVLLLIVINNLLGSILFRAIFSLLITALLIYNIFNLYKKNAYVLI